MEAPDGFVLNRHFFEKYKESADRVKKQSAEARSNSFSTLKSAETKSNFSELPKTEANLTQASKRQSLYEKIKTKFGKKK